MSSKSKSKAPSSDRNPVAPKSTFSVEVETVSAVPEIPVKIRGKRSENKEKKEMSQAKTEKTAASSGTKTTGSQMKFTRKKTKRSGHSTIHSKRNHGTKSDSQTAESNKDGDKDGESSSEVRNFS